MSPLASPYGRFASALTPPLCIDWWGAKARPRPVAVPQRGALTFRGVRAQRSGHRGGGGGGFPLQRQSGSDRWGPCVPGLELARPEQLSKAHLTSEGQKPSFCHYPWATC